MVKLRWSNGNNYAVEFEANDPQEFQHNAMSALRSFRIVTERRVHRGEICKTVSWFENCELGVYDPAAHIWYYPEGEQQCVETNNFGRLWVNRHFTIRPARLEFESLDGADYRIKMIGIDPVTFDELDLYKTEDSNRMWELCVGAYNRSKNIHGFIDGFMQDFELL